MNNKGANFQQTFYSFILFLLVVLGLLNLTFHVQRDNNAVNPVSNNVLFNDTATRLSSNVTQSESSSKIQQGIFSDETPKPGFGSIVLFGIVSAGKTFTNMIYSYFALLFRIPIVVLGIDSAIVSVFITILIITLIIGVWIIYKIGG